MVKVGDKIRIIEMSSEPQYAGKTGIVEKIISDPWGETQIWGTWGGCCLYLEQDQFEVLGNEDTFEITEEIVQALKKLKAAKEEYQKYPEDKGVLDALTDAQYNLLDLL